MIICGFKCFLLASSLCLMAQTLLAGNLDIKNGKWKIAFNKNTQTIDYLYQETTLLKETFVQAINASGEVLKSSDYPIATLKRENISDTFGKGKNIHMSIPAGPVKKIWNKCSTFIPHAIIC